jgi:hypothetical protein
MPYLFVGGSEVLTVNQNLLVGRSNNVVTRNCAVNIICYKLQRLVADNPTNDLTDDQTHILINELKSRMVNLYQDRISGGVTSRSCSFKDIGFIFSRGTVLYERGDKLTNEFTSLLDKLIATRSDYFTKDGSGVAFAGTPIKHICSKLIDSV